MTWEKARKMQINANIDLIKKKNNSFSLIKYIHICKALHKKKSDQYIMSIYSEGAEINLLRLKI